METIFLNNNRFDKRYSNMIYVQLMKEKKTLVGSGEKEDEIQIKERGQHIFHIIMNIE